MSVGVLAVWSLANTRPVPAWDHDMLMKQADLVIIGLAVGTKSLKTADGLEAEWRDLLKPFETTVDVSLVLKGSRDLKQVRLVHFHRPDAARVTNGPYVLNFEISKPVEKLREDGESRTAPEYLLFLRKRQDGTFEAVSGHHDPGYSAFELRPMRIVFD
jgi:hypothetical protein